MEATSNLCPGRSLGIYTLRHVVFCRPEATRNHCQRRASNEEHESRSYAGTLAQATLLIWLSMPRVALISIVNGYIDSGCMIAFVSEAGAGGVHLNIDFLAVTRTRRIG